MLKKEEQLKGKKTGKTRRSEARKA